MTTDHPKQPIVLRKEKSNHSKAMAQSHSLPHGLVMRAKLMLIAVKEISNNLIAEKLDLSPESIC